MPEFPIIMSQNILDGAKITGNEITGHELERMRDGHRHTWWQAPGTSAQFVEIRAKNLITNSDFEIDLAGWVRYFGGAGAGTFTRNTTAPIEGVADGLVTATTADASADIMGALYFQPFFFRAGRTYRIMFRALQDGPGVKQIRFGFLKEGFVEDALFYKSENANTTDTGHYFDAAPTVDGWFQPFIRCLEPQALQFDEVVVGEVRENDTLIIDGGHTLFLAGIDIDYRNTETAIWSNVAGPSFVSWPNKAPVFITFTGVKALAWRVKFSVFTLNPDIDVAKAPLMFIGKRWTLPHHFSGSFDPDQEDRFEDFTKGDRGIAQRSLKYNQRVFRAAFSHINATHYLDVEKFFEDTDNGTKPFFFAWQPTTKPHDILCMRLRRSREVPFRNGALRDWNFEAEELAGRREI